MRRKDKKHGGEDEIEEEDAYYLKRSLCFKYGLHTYNITS